MKKDKTLYTFRLPKHLRAYPERWVSGGFSHIDVKIFLEWAFAVTVEDFENDSNGLGLYQATYDDYFRIIIRDARIDIDSERFRKDAKNSWNLILVFARALRTELDMDFVNRSINANLDNFAVHEYEAGSGIIVLEVMEEQ